MSQLQLFTPLYITVRNGKFKNPLARDYSKQQLIRKCELGYLNHSSSCFLNKKTYVEDNNNYYNASDFKDGDLVEFNFNHRVCYARVLSKYSGDICLHILNKLTYDNEV